MIDVTPEQRTEILGILRRLVPFREISAFGSRTDGTAKPHSDLDLVVLGDERLPIELSARLEHAFDESTLPFKVDLVEWATASDAMRERIRATAVPLVTSG